MERRRNDYRLVEGIHQNMTRKFILKDNGRNIIIEGCGNCGSHVKGFYELWYSSHLGKWICRKCYNEFEYENKLPEHN